MSGQQRSKSVIRCRCCRLKRPRGAVNSRGFCGAPRCQAACDRLLAKAFGHSEPIVIAPSVPPPAKELPAPHAAVTPAPGLTREQQLRLSALARARMTTSEGLSPE